MSSSATAVPYPQRVASVASAAAVDSNTQSQHQQHTQDSRFSCNICLEAVSEPVVTQCGHLYCWPCLYKWLEPGMLPLERQALSGAFSTGPVNESRRVCPVCKATCSVPDIVPIYVRTEPGVQDEQRSIENDLSLDLEEEEEEEDAVTDASPAGGLASDHETPFTTADTTTNNTNGLRQRLRFRSRDSEIPAPDATDATADIPARPAASSPTRPRSASTASAASTSTPPPLRSNGWVTPLSPNTNYHNNYHNQHRGASLSHGLALTLQQALRPATTGVAAVDDQIPPLHHRHGSSSSSAAAVNGYNNNGNSNMSAVADPDATEFLSRILLMLGSFVVLCLLLF